MGAVFEGILCSVSLTKINWLNFKLSSPLNWEIAALNDCLVVISRVEANRSFSQEVEAVASQVSLLFSSSLLVRYDDRIAHRSSILFEEGLPIKTFGENDEIWVLLDEDGDPIVDGERFTSKQVDENEDNEYETILNAIQLGMDALRVDDWKELHSFMTNSRSHKIVWRSLSQI